MSENQLGENIARYRKERGLSQEKVAEYMGVSRQAVTKWERNLSKPNSEHLIKLAALFEISVSELLDKEGREDVSNETNISPGKMPWIFIGISIVCIIAYGITSTLLDFFSIGVLICMFIICIPIQLFLHIFFSNAIKLHSFNGIASFDNNIEYNTCEVKKLLVQTNLHIGMMSTVYIFLLCALNFLDLNIGWLNGLLLVLYGFNFVGTCMINNYKMIDKIYRNNEDKERALRSIPVTLIYVIFVFMGIGITGVLFEMKGIENNTEPAMKLCGLLFFGVVTATIGFLLESNQIKKWKPAETKHRTNKVSIGCLLVCGIVYGLMCIV